MGESVLSKDETTGVFTEASFQYLLKRKMELAEANAENIGLLLVDPDHFSVLSVFPEETPAIKKAIALRLRGCLRAADIIAHATASTFAVILDEIENPDAASRVARKVIQSIGGSYQAGDETIELHCSVGVVCASPYEVNLSSLLARAEKALSFARAEGGGQFHYYIEFLDTLLRK